MKKGRSFLKPNPFLVALLLLCLGLFWYWTRTKEGFVQTDSYPYEHFYGLIIFTQKSVATWNPTFVQMYKSSPDTVKIVDMESKDDLVLEAKNHYKVQTGPPRIFMKLNDGTNKFTEYTGKWETSELLKTVQRTNTKNADLAAAAAMAPAAPAVSRAVSPAASAAVDAPIDTNATF